MCVLKQCLDRRQRYKSVKFYTVNFFIFSEHTFYFLDVFTAGNDELADAVSYCTILIYIGLEKYIHV